MSGGTGTPPSVADEQQVLLAEYSRWVEVHNQWDARLRKLLHDATVVTWPGPRKK